MCLAVPGKLIRLTGSEGVVDLHGNRLPVSTLLVPEAKEGDWLLVHAGFAIQRLDEQEAQETFAVLREAGLDAAAVTHEGSDKREEGS